jgi:hypothetical protein
VELVAFLLVGVILLLAVGDVDAVLLLCFWPLEPATEGVVVVVDGEGDRELLLSVLFATPFIGCKLEDDCDGGDCCCSIIGCFVVIELSAIGTE